MAQRQVKAFMLMFIMFLAPLAGCFGEADERVLDASALTIEGSGALQGGMWQQITLSANDDVAVYILYFIQDIGVATLGWNGLVDGYPCYHRECDTMETMIEYMDTDNSTGINNLVHSWDIVTWWAVYAFLHMDQTPVPNEL